MKRRITSIFLLGAILFAGCGGDDDGGTPAATGGSGGTGGDTGGTGGTGATGGGTGGSDGGTGASGGTGGSVGPDETAPTVVSTAPADSATGVAKDTTIVITFAEPMNKLATQSAYQSADIPAEDVTFSWNSAGTVLTITPNADLTYATGTDPGDVTATSYSFTFTNVAEDLAGNLLAEVTFSFSTSREITQTFVADGTLTGNWRGTGDNGADNCAPDTNLCAGDATTNAKYTGLITFDVSALPATISEILGATVTAAQITTPEGNAYALGDLKIVHLIYAALDGTAASTSFLTDLGQFATGYADANPAKDVLVQVQDDYANRVGRLNRSQYRLTFPVVSTNATQDVAKFPEGTIELDVHYLIP
jgi:hypothetical protein